MKGRTGGGAELVAVTDGTVPRVGVGLFMTSEPDAAAMDDEVEPVGLAGRSGLVVAGIDGGDGPEGTGVALATEGEAIVEFDNGGVFVDED